MTDLELAQMHERDWEQRVATLRADLAAAESQWHDARAKRVQLAIDEHREQQVPRHLLVALSNATRAMASGDDAALATVNEYLQPLVDAAMARVKRARRAEPSAGWDTKQ